MKYILFYSIISTFLLVSCNTDDICSDNLNDVIVNQFEVELLGSQQGTVEFLANGDLVDNNDILIPGLKDSTILTKKTYVVKNNGLIQLEARNGVIFIIRNVVVKSFSCDEMVWDILGVEINFKVI